MISRLTLSFARASLSPASDLDVSAENPSRRDEVEEASEDRGRGTGSETDLIVGRSSSFPSISIRLVDAPSGVVKDLGTCMGPETSRARGCARGPLPSEDGYDGFRRTTGGASDTAFSSKTASVLAGPVPEVVRLAGRRSAIPSEGFGLEAPAPAVAETARGGRDDFAARTGILLGGAILALFGSGLTSFAVLSAEPPCAVAFAKVDVSVGTRNVESWVAVTFERGVVKLNGMGTVGVMRDMLGVCFGTIGADLPGVLSRDIEESARCGDAIVVLTTTGDRNCFDTDSIGTSS